jgi:hypothetical protein
LLLPRLILLPGIASFPYPSPGSRFSDLSISHYPNAIYLKRAILEFHTVPLWSPTILSGYPFAANPLSGLWYPPGWLSLLFPLPLGFNLLAALHLLWGGAGMFLFLRARGLGHVAALFGALAFEATPKLFAHYGAGHLTLLYAVCWTPWLLLSSTQRGANRFLRPGVILALIFLADPRWAACAGIVWLAREFAHSQNTKTVTFRHILKQGALAFFLSAPLLFPLTEYARLSTRAALEPADVFAFSLEPVRLLGLLFPDCGGFHEWMLYPGGAVFALASLALVWPALRGKAKFWLWVVVASLLFSLGSNLPGLGVLAYLPGFSLLRVPARALFLTGFAFAVVSAYALDHLLSGPDPLEQRRARLTLAGLVAFTLTFAFVLWGLTGELPLNFAWTAGLLFLVSMLVGLYLRGVSWGRIWIVLFFALNLADWGFVDRSLFASRPAPQALSEGRELAEYLSAQPGYFRIYSPSYSLPQQTAAFYGFELADGVDPLQLRAYADFMHRASGVSGAGYSVTLPPFEGDPTTANRAYAPDPSQLGRLNVAFVAAEFPLAVEGLEFVGQFGSSYLYENLYSRPRATLNEADAESGIVSWAPDKIVFEVEGPGRLVLSEINYPGWRVLVDGNPAELLAIDGLFRGVDVPAGVHRVEFVFRPVSVYLGLIAAFATILLIAVWRPRSSLRS